MRFDPELAFDNYIRQLDSVFERTGLERAALCGVSYGGFIALRYAALRPERVSRLILVSAPAPGLGAVGAAAALHRAPVAVAPEVRADRAAARCGRRFRPRYDTWPRAR